MRLHQAASILGVSERTILRYIDNGVLNAHKEGRTVLVDDEQIHALAKKRGIENEQPQISSQELEIRKIEAEAEKAKAEADKIIAEAFMQMLSKRAVSNPLAVGTAR